MTGMIMPTIWRTNARKRAVLHEENDCITFAGFMDILAPRYGIHWTHTPNGGKRHIKTAVRLKRMGVRAGVWDFYFRKAGLPTHWEEFKHGSNKLTPEQIAWRFDLLPMGDTFDVAFNYMQALAHLTSRKFLPMGAYIPCGSTIRIPLRP